MQGTEIRIRGTVQGVGFRPFVWRLANELGLRGWVRNDGAGVIAAVDGKNWPEFEGRLRAGAPRLARIDSIASEPFDGELPGEGFVILDDEDRQGHQLSSSSSDSAPSRPAWYMPVAAK